MKLLLPLLLICLQGRSQDSLLTYTRVLTAESVSPTSIFDKTMIWCGRRLSYSKAAIDFSDKSSGVISGKAQLKFTYKIPKKKDSVESIVYSPFYFKWLMEIKEGKMRVSLTEIEYAREGLYPDTYPVKIGSKPPIGIMFMASKKVQMEWDMAIKYFIVEIDKLMDDLQENIRKKDEW